MKISDFEDVSDALRRVGQRLRKEWEGEPEKVPIIVQAGYYGRETCQLAVEDQEVVFEVAEEMMTHGDEQLQTAVATGFLEAVVHAAERGECDFRAIRDLLGPRSRRQVDAYRNFM